MTLKCLCGALNRIPRLPRMRVRCGKCHHVFTPLELVTATLEKPPSLAELTKMILGNGEPDDVEVEEND